MPEEPNEQPQQPAQGTPPPDPPIQSGDMSEAEIQQAIANSTDWIQKGEDKSGVERR